MTLPQQRPPAPPPTPSRQLRYPYRRTEVQRRAHVLSHVDELLYGGAAGGGKTDFALAEAVRTCLENPGANVLILRRTFPDLSRPGGIIYRLRLRIPKRLGTYNANDHTWTFANGSVLELGHLSRDADVLKYQGSEYALIVFDELTQFTRWQFDYMRSRLRVAGRLVGRVHPRLIGTTNPGGPGHGWVKATFIDPAPPYKVHRAEPTLDEPTPPSRVFVPAKVSDNPHIDPGYVDRLNRLDDDTRRALLFGDWDVFQGQRFAAFRRQLHVIDPEQLPIPAGTPRAIGVDYGFDAPFVALWGARLADDLVVIYRELAAPGLTPTEQANAILDAETVGERITYRPPVHIDPSTYARDPAQPRAHVPSELGAHVPPAGSIASRYMAAGLPTRRANNDRLLGVATVADKLRVRGTTGPRLLIYSTCTYLIRTLPALPRDPKHPEDVDTKADDHAYDALRYLLLGMGHTAPKPPSSDETRRALGRTETGELRAAGF